MKKMVDFKADERLNTLNHSCAHVMAQAVKHLYPQAKFWVGPVVKEGFYYDIDLGDDIINDEAIAAIEKEMKKVCKEGKKIYRREISKAEAMEMFKDDPLNSVFAEVMPGAQSRGPSPKWPEISTAIYTAVQEVLTGQKDVDTALATAQGTIDEVNAELNK